jgi:MoxR-like ATPase
MSGAAVHLASELNAVRSRPHEPEMSGYHVPLRRLARSPVEERIRRLVSREERVLLVGPMGSGKTSLIADLASDAGAEIVTAEAVSAARAALGA